MPFTLRPYQQTFIAAIRKAIMAYKRVVACAATGSGKSKVFVTIAQSALSKGKTVLVISESVKIFEQIRRELSATLINAGSDHSFIQPGKCYLAMAQTLVRRSALVQQFNLLNTDLLIINDEAHVGTSTKLLSHLPDSLLIGFTATPDFRHAKHLPTLYQAIVVGPQPDELVNDGWLASYRHFARVSADLNLLKLEKGEFTEESQERVFESRQVYDGLVTDLNTVAFTKALIFTASIKHCEALYETLIAHGIQCVRVHSKLPPATASYSLSQFTHQDIKICISVGVLTKGFDHPPIDLVVLQRATTSLPLYLQMIGRGSRTDQDKQSFTVLDYGGNYSRHGLWDMERDWTKMWNAAPKRKKDSPAPVKFCPKCEFIMNVSRMVCPNCGHAFTPSEQDSQASKLVEVTAAYRQLVGKKISQLTPIELSTYARLKNKKGYAARVARAREQSTPGFLHEFCQTMGYQAGWAHFQMKSITDEPIQYFDITLR